MWDDQSQRNPPSTLPNLASSLRLVSSERTAALSMPIASARLMRHVSLMRWMGDLRAASVRFAQASCVPDAISSQATCEV